MKNASFGTGCSYILVVWLLSFIAGFCLINLFINGVL